jgi:hypothetical protein
MLKDVSNLTIENVLTTEKKCLHVCVSPSEQLTIGDILSLMFELFNSDRPICDLKHC